MFWYKLFDINCYKLLLLLMSLTISCCLSFCHIFLSIFFFFFLMLSYSKSCFLSSFLPLLLVTWVNIYIIISKFLNDKSREINLQTFLISDSSVNFALLAVPCLYYVICHSRSVIRDYHQSRSFFNYKPDSLVSGTWHR